MEFNWDNLTEGQIAAMKAYAEEIRNENKNDGGANMDLEGIKEGLSKVEEAVKGLKTKEKTKAEKQMEKLIKGNDPLREAAMEKFLAMTTNQQAAWRKENPEAYEKLFAEEKPVTLQMPQGFKELKEKMLKDPTKLHTVPLNVWTYASIADKDFYQYLEGAGEVIRMERSVDSGNPALRKLQQMEKDAAGE